MKRSDFFPSNYLTAEDLPNEGMVVTIHHLETGKMRDGKVKPIMFFDELEKGLVINVTKFKLLEKLHGDESDDWTDKRITIYPSETTMEGEVVPCINIKNKIPKPAVKVAENGKRTKSATPTAPVKAREPGDDDGVEDEDDPGY